MNSNNLPNLNNVPNDDTPTVGGSTITRNPTPFSTNMSANIHNCGNVYHSPTVSRYPYHSNLEFSPTLSYQNTLHQPQISIPNNFSYQNDPNCVNPFGNFSNQFQQVGNSYGVPTLRMRRLLQQSKSPNDFPEFSTQIGSEETDDPSDIAINSPILTTAESRSKWTTTEDILLCKAWCYIGTDPITSNNQKGDKMWERIAARFNETKSHEVGTRNAHKCRCRWSSRIRPAVEKFCSCLTKASRRQTSGESSFDVISHAHQIYKDLYNEDFTLEHCWREVKDQPKWLKQDSCVKRTKLNENGDYSSSPSPSPRTRTASPTDSPTCETPPTSSDVEIVGSSSLPRPPGIKAAKTKGKKATTVNLFGEINDIGQKFEALRSDNEAKAEMGKKYIEVKKEELKTKKIDQLIRLMEIDKSKMTETELEIHNLMCDKLRKELFD